MRITFVNLAVLALTLPACSASFGDSTRGGDGVAPSGTGTTRTYPVTGFSRVELAGSDDVDVRVGPAFSVRAEGPAEVLDRLRIDKDGDALTVGRKRGISFGGPHRSAKVFVTLPRMTGATLSGSGNMAVDGAAGASFSGSLAGSGDLSVTGLRTGAANFDLAGSGDVTAAGRADRLAVSVAGSGNVDGRQLAARGAKVSVAGSGDVTAVVDGDATVDLMGSGDVDLGERARCSVHKMGSGEIRCAR